MEKVLAGFKKSYLLVPISVIFGSIMMYVDSLFSKTETPKKDYLRLSLIIGIITTAIIYIHNTKGKIDEEISSGSPPF